MINTIKMKYLNTLSNTHNSNSINSEMQKEINDNLNKLSKIIESINSE